MAQAKVFYKAKSFLGFIASKNIFYSKVYSEEYLSEIKDNKRLYRVLKEKNYPVSKIFGEKRNVIVKEHLPFRVKFTTIGIEGYGPNNPPPIGIAVIGFNNYIL